MSRFHPSMSWSSSGNHGREELGQDSEAVVDDNGREPTGSKWKHASRPPDQQQPPSSAVFEQNPRSGIRSYRRFFLPLHYTATYQYPLVIWLHNDGFNENQIDQVMPHISVRNHIGVGVRGNRAADSSGHRFDWHDSPAAVGIAHDAIVEASEAAADRFAIHPSRIVLAGYGAGGTMAMRVAMRNPQRFAAVVSVGGRVPQRAIGDLNEIRRRRLPMLWQWASGNREYSSENLKADCRFALTIGGQVEVRQYPGDDEMDTVVLADLNEWIMRRVIACATANDADRWASTPTAYSAN